MSWRYYDVHFIFILFCFLFLAETLCWYKDDEVGFKLKILEFMLQGTFQG